MEQGLKILEKVPEQLDLESAAGRRAAWTSLFGVKGEVYLVQKKGDLAAEWFAKAARLAPEVPMAPRWKSLSVTPGPQVFGESIGP